ncbi:unnamed protein product [Rhodiola kirilowii]
MGNLCSDCGSSPPDPKAKKTNNNSNRWSRIRSNSTRTDNKDVNHIDRRIHQQALAAAILYQQQQQRQGGALPFDRSASLRYPVPVSKKGLPRSSSSRTPSLADPLLHPHQLAAHQELNLDDLETKHIVLVHGGGFGAWCWYKTISLLEDNGFKVMAVDLTGAGIHSCDPNSITSLSQYVEPLCNFLEKLSDEEKVILVGHDLGGVCISYAMELFPSKIAKAIYIAAAMLTTGLSVTRMFSQKVYSNELIQQAQIFRYSNGSKQPPTAIDLEKSLLRDLLFNQSSTKDVALASVSMRPTPFAPLLENLTLSDTNYGSIRRFYIKTPEDNAVPIALQEDMINANPPEQVFLLKGADHSPFFSKPQALHKLLVEISRMGPLEK